ncbi:MAG: hypothetical protein HOP08_08530 [Cyclobacteriaceae bacterium]|nr:hypothetical protein [Cyclobacteriaceae bacterium]
MEKNQNDNWGLKELFHFDEKHWIIYNDTNSLAKEKILDGRLLDIPVGGTYEIQPDSHSIVLPNRDKIKFSNRSLHEASDFWANFNVITSHLVRNLKDGLVIGGLDFLDYHYSWTKKKKRFLKFVKHYIVTVSWMPTDQKDKFDMHYQAVKEWAEEKERKSKRPFYIIALSIPIIVYAFGWYFSVAHKEVFIGALIGGLAGPIKEIYDLYKD